MAKLKKQQEEIEQQDLSVDVQKEPVNCDKTEHAEIPEYVDRVMKMYPNYAELAIDQQGGVYTKGSQHISKGKAILYQNPYYKQ